MAQGYEGQEPGLTCPSAGPGGSGEAEPGRGRGRAGVRLTRGTTLAQRDPGNETRREEGGLVFSLGICFYTLNFLLGDSKCNLSPPSPGCPQRGGKLGRSGLRV